MPQPKSILAVGKPELVAVRYIDGHGKDATRLAVKIGGQHYLLRETISGTNILQEASPWLEKGIKEFKPPARAESGGGLKATKS